MKRLTLMRHADARWQDAKLSDLERPLNRRGSVAAEAMAKRLLELELVPDLLLVSPARRTRQTGEIVARQLSLPARLVMSEEALYLASAADLLKAVQATGPRVQHLLVIAHNPGVSELVQQLVPEAEAGGLGTAALCSMAFETPHWTAIGVAAVQDVLRETPRARGLFGLFG
ncbi:MAG TPA: histidine phosphatase family protein [Steroidobacteraceae bacterium]|jgi:phosphohistidine phosphatase|nr:histidine phosphatase family protein [Steroidobacteraceae bacterium]